MWIELVVNVCFRFQGNDHKLFKRSKINILKDNLNHVKCSIKTRKGRKRELKRSKEYMQQIENSYKHLDINQAIS